MARWQIRQLPSKILVMEYCSSRCEQATGYFGGEWNDPEKYLHIRVPAELENLSMDQLELVYGTAQSLDPEGQPLWDYVSNDNEQENLCYSDGSPAYSASGVRLTAPRVQKVPRQSQRYYLRKKK